MLFRPLLPESVRLAEMPPAEADPAHLYPEELRHIERAVEKRRREFAAGRLLAREALASAGIADDLRLRALLPEPDRSPRWPEGVVGSITHCASLCAVAVAHAQDCAGLGLDVEPAQPLKSELLPQIVRPEEFERFDALPDAVRALGGIAAFAMKEALYKAIYPIRRRFLEFHDVEILRVGGASDIAHAATDWRGEFEAIVRVEDARLTQHPRIVGRVRIAHGHVAAAVFLPAA
ncbi:MAG: 4'-phosphopantetheinyl transferase superfamily protein [Xanthomonadaceae bacterium]|nr:4'-phosphopantetheinyl transferase superfamily protein [Xanthomonadaceae bacterium]